MLARPIIRKFLKKVSHFVGIAMDYIEDRFNIQLNDKLIGYIALFLFTSSVIVVLIDAQEQSRTGSKLKCDRHTRAKMFQFVYSTSSSFPQNWVCQLVANHQAERRLKEQAPIK